MNHAEHYRENTRTRTVLGAMMQPFGPQLDGATLTETPGAATDTLFASVGGVVGHGHALPHALPLSGKYSFESRYQPPTCLPPCSSNTLFGWPGLATHW